MIPNTFDGEGLGFPGRQFPGTGVSESAEPRKVAAVRESGETTTEKRERAGGENLNLKRGGGGGGRREARERDQDWPAPQ